jgi:4-hydroxy 2-oxovalerate aldolase
MKTIKILDCTLRDGGFVNDWNFGYNSIRDIISRLERAGIDIIEVGFLDARRNYDKNKSIFPYTENAKNFFRNIHLKKMMAVAMIDYGTCPPDHIEDCADSVLDGIRVIFKKKDLDAALDFCSQIKEKGYKVFVQPVSITTYSDEELLLLMRKVNKLYPYSLSIVDTYGLMLKRDLIRLYYLIDHNLEPDICLGYHAHNNFQLAFANCADLLDNLHSNRNIILDSTLFGMGKSAGNCNTELLVNFLNSCYDKAYDIHQILENIYTNILPIHQQTPWGYRMEYFLSASNDCHPMYIQYLMEKNTLSVKSISEIIAMIAPINKLTFNEKIISNLYLQYQQNNINDEDACKWLEKFLKEREILIFAPGASLIAERKKVEEYINQNTPLIFSVNFIPLDFNVECAFFSNAKRYLRALDQYYFLEHKPIIMATSNIVESTIPINYIFNYGKLTFESKIENSMLMLLQLLIDLKIEKATLAGFDGFSTNQLLNYTSSEMQVAVSKAKIESDNLEIKKQISRLRENICLHFLTNSIYE